MGYVVATGRCGGGGGGGDGGDVGKGDVGKGGGSGSGSGWNARKRNIGKIFGGIGACTVVEQVLWVLEGGVGLVGKRGVG